MCSSTDCPGPIATNAKDCELMYRIIAGADPKDATSHNLLDKVIKEKKVIGLPKQYFSKDISPDFIKSVMETTKVLGDLGYKFIEVDLMDSKYAIAVYTVVQRSEVSSNLSRYDGIRFGNDRSFFGKEAKRRITLGTYVLSSGYYDAYYLQAQKVRTLICRDFDKVFNQVDFLLAPTTPTTALRVGATADQFMFGELQDVLLEASSLAGLPAISMPCGFDSAKLPYGFQIIGPQNSDYRLLNLGIEYQQVTDWHTKKSPMIK